MKIPLVRDEGSKGEKIYLKNHTVYTKSVKKSSASRL